MLDDVQRAEGNAASKFTITEQSAGSKTRQILEMQRVLKEDTCNTELKPLERAGCARAWEVLEERLRIIRNKPLPGHLKPEERARKRRVKEPDTATPMSMPKAA